LNQHNDPVQVFVGNLIVRSRPAAEAAPGTPNDVSVGG
jgi:hypothetical protein